MNRKPGFGRVRLAVAAVGFLAVSVPAAAHAGFAGWWSRNSVTVSGTVMDRWTLTCEPTGSDTIASAFDVGVEDTAYLVTGNGPDPKWSTRDQTTSASADGYTHFLFSAANVAQVQGSSADGELGDMVLAEGIYGAGWTTATAVLQIVTPAGEYTLNATSGMLGGVTIEDGVFDGGPPGVLVSGSNEVPILIQLPPPIPGDANDDGRVDVNDLTIVLANFGQTGAVWSQGDFNGDGRVDVNDLTILLTNFGHTAGAAAPTAVPEPSALVLAAGGLAGAAAFVRRKRFSQCRQNARKEV